MEQDTQNKAPLAAMLSDGDLIKQLDLRTRFYDSLADEQAETSPACSVQNRLTARTFRHASAIVASDIGCARPGAENDEIPPAKI